MYHNATHVCDVVHAAWWVLEQGGLAEMMQPRAVFAALCAAAAHDTGHPGLNNVFWAASGSERSLFFSNVRAPRKFLFAPGFARA